MHTKSSTIGLLLVLLAFCSADARAQKDPNQFIARIVSKGAISDDGSHVGFAVVYDDVREPQIPHPSFFFYKYFDAQSGLFIRPDTNFSRLEEMRYLRYSVNNGPDEAPDPVKQSQLEEAFASNDISSSSHDAVGDIQCVGTLSNGNDVYSKYFISSDDWSKEWDKRKHALKASYCLAEYDNQQHKVARTRTFKVLMDEEYYNTAANSYPYGMRFYSSSNQYLAPDGESIFLFGRWRSAKNGKPKNNNYYRSPNSGLATIKFSSDGGRLYILDSKEGVNTIQVFDPKDGRELSDEENTIIGKYMRVPAYDSRFDNQNPDDKESALHLVDFTPDFSYCLYMSRNKGVVKNTATGALVWLGDSKINPLAMMRNVINSNEQVVLARAEQERREEERIRQMEAYRKQHSLTADYFGPSAEQAKKEAAYEKEWQKTHPQNTQTVTTAPKPVFDVSKKDNTEEQRMQQMKKEANAREKAYNDKWGYYSH